MKRLTVYDIYLDDMNGVIKVAVPATSKRDAAKYVEGNGEIVCIKENEIVPDIDTNCLANTLRANGWGQTEIDVITRTLQRCGLERLG